MNNAEFSPSRRAWNRFFTAAVWVAAALVIVLVAGIIAMVLARGIPHIRVEFLTTTASVLKGTDGILPAILNTLYVILLTLLIVLPLGVGAAVYLTEYATNRRLIEVIEFTNETLAGIPSIIYGLVGMLVFAQTLGFKTCLLSGSLTLVIMNLPTIIRTTQESLKTVPQGYREGALGLGAGKWHIIRTIVLPCSVDGIVTGCILAVGRIVGESAALLFTAGLGHRRGAAGAGAGHQSGRPACQNETETEAITEAIIEGLLCLIQPLSSRPKTSTSGMGISRP